MKMIKNNELVLINGATMQIGGNIPNNNELQSNNNILFDGSTIHCTGDLTISTTHDGGNINCTGNLTISTVIRHNNARINCTGGLTITGNVFLE